MSLLLAAPAGAGGALYGGNCRNFHASSQAVAKGKTSGVGKCFLFPDLSIFICFSYLYCFVLSEQVQFIKPVLSLVGDGEAHCLAAPDHARPRARRGKRRVLVQYLPDFLGVCWVRGLLKGEET